MSVLKRNFFLAILLSGIRVNAAGPVDSIAGTAGTTAAGTSASNETSGNPIISTIRSADPAAKVWNDGRVWIYSSHDEDDATDYSTIDGYHVFSSSDLVNWTDHGEVLNSGGVAWGNPDGGWMFAPDAAFRNDTFYLYFPHLSNEWKWRIGVAVAAAPWGPFTDTGHFIEGTDNIDPACFVDDDGTAYLLWGGDGSTPKIARLRDNMTGLAETPRDIDYGTDNFGEGGYLHKRNGIYYFSYTCNTCWPYQGYFAMGDNPYGPFEYRGELKRIPPGAQDHHSMIEYHGQWYYFYHVGNYGPDGSAFRRNICIDSLYYNPDGTMREVIGTATGVGTDLIGSAPGRIVPGHFRASEFFMQEGTGTVQASDSAILVGGIDEGDWLEYVLDILERDNYMATFFIREALPGTRIFLEIDGEPGDTLIVNADTGLVSTPVFLYNGRHTLKLLFSHPVETADLLKLDRIEMEGNAEYFSVEISLEGEGSFETSGGTVPYGREPFLRGPFSYYLAGDSVEIRLLPGYNYILDSVRIDGVLQELSSEYTLYDISADHRIRAHYSECLTIASWAYYRLNDNPPVSAKEIAVTEGNDLKLIVGYDPSASIEWEGPGGVMGHDSILVLDSIRSDQEGSYRAVLVNDQGCLTEQVFQVSVENVELDVYEAEAFSNQSGIVLENCTDLGGGKYVSQIENNDLCYYFIRIDTAGYYGITARVATASNGGSIEISNRDSLLAVVPVEGSLSGGWEDWFTTTPVEAGFAEGTHHLRFTFRGTGGILFNFNWFDLDFIRGFDDGATGVGKLELQAWPNPSAGDTRIMFRLSEASEVDLEVYNSSGILLRKIISSEILGPGTHTYSWDPSVGNQIPQSAGICFIRLRCGGSVYVKKIILGPGE